METIKNLVIGFGKGGKTLAKTLAQHGEAVMVVEQSMLAVCHPRI